MIILKWILIGFGIFFLLILFAALTIPLWLPLLLKLFARYFLRKHASQVKEVLSEDFISVANSYVNSKSGDIPQQAGRFRDEQIIDVDSTKID